MKTFTTGKNCHRQEVRKSTTTVDNAIADVDETSGRIVLDYGL